MGYANYLSITFSEDDLIFLLYHLWSLVDSETFIELLPNLRKKQGL